MAALIGSCGCIVGGWRDYQGTGFAGLTLEPVGLFFKLIGVALQPAPLERLGLAVGKAAGAPREVAISLGLAAEGKGPEHSRFTNEQKPESVPGAAAGRTLRRRSRPAACRATLQGR